ncbi:MAG: DUF4903 domain-containing protein [Dysgonamonadaceae bacterium]|jgi:hypothetical protein|nr:DUF4903 domain-containing protein [Dysgonamonadaceae bacterium]
MTKKVLLKPAIFAVFGLTVLLCISFAGCKTDDEIIGYASRLRTARETLQDSIVLSAHATMNGTNLTKLERGCPVKFYFSWINGDTVNLQIRDFHVGKMPLSLSFSINLKFMDLNDWDKDEYTGSGWIKFVGDGGVSTMSGTERDGNGIVTGYFNANTKEIEFVTDFNVASVTLDVYQQSIDFGRMANYNDELAEYESALAALGQ